MRTGHFYPVTQDTWLSVLYVLDADGKLLRPQRANEFEDGDTYNVPRFARFLTVYGAHSRSR